MSDRCAGPACVAGPAFFCGGRVVESCAREAARIGPHAALARPWADQAATSVRPSTDRASRAHLLALDPTLGFLASRKSYWNRRQNRPVRWLIRLRFGILFGRVRKRAPVGRVCAEPLPSKEETWKTKTRLPSRPPGASASGTGTGARTGPSAPTGTARRRCGRRSRTSGERRAAEHRPVGGDGAPAARESLRSACATAAGPAPTVQPLSRPSPMARRSPPSPTGRPSSPASPTGPRPSSPASRTTSPASRCSRTSRRATARR